MAWPSRRIVHTTRRSFESQFPMQPAFVARSDVTMPSLAHFDERHLRPAAPTWLPSLTSRLFRTCACRECEFAGEPGSGPSGQWLGCPMTAVSAPRVQAVKADYGSTRAWAQGRQPLRFCPCGATVSGSNGPNSVLHPYAPDACSTGASGRRALHVRSGKRPCVTA